MMNPLHNHFLVSMPQLQDPNFSKSVILLCKHDESGAIGIVINKLTEHCVGDILNHLEIPSTSEAFTRNPVLCGGPVYPELGLVIHNCGARYSESSIKIDNNLYLTSSREILDDMAQGEGPEQALLSLGYSGWGPGQLEDEIRENSWLTTPVDRSILFSDQVQDKWQLSTRILGINSLHLSDQVGHA